MIFKSKLHLNFSNKLLFSEQNFSRNRRFRDTLYSCHADLSAFSLVRSFTRTYNAIGVC